MRWWWWFAGVIPAHLLVHLCCRRPLRQDTRYHRFADARPCCGIPNAMDVLSNAGFAAVGARGALSWLGRPEHPLCAVWLTFFAGIAATALGSAYYHWDPCNDRLVWDRLPMTVGFSSLFVAMVYEGSDWAASDGAGMHLCLCLHVLSGAYSVWHWHMYDDLRMYAVVQFYPVLCALCLASPAYFRMVVWYLLAKGVEVADRPIFEMTGKRVSGHTLKHIFAAVATGIAPAA